MLLQKSFALFWLYAMNLGVLLACPITAPMVKIEQGMLKGRASADGKIFEYIGIPYATANATNRFQANLSLAPQRARHSLVVSSNTVDDTRLTISLPLCTLKPVKQFSEAINGTLDGSPFPAPKWEGIYNAIQEFSCPQVLPVLGVVGTEDCLKANVYTPAVARKSLPVMVYIHGGGFYGGDGGKLIYGPEFIVKQDVILITINYRVGVYGFLCLGIKEAPGNAGLKDQIAALQWVKNNVAAFGGDPDNITIFGQSAGAGSVSLILASDAANGLFNRAIVQSGSSIANWAVNRDPTAIASLLVKSLGYDTEDPQELYKILYNTPYEELLTAELEKSDVFLNVHIIFFAPCIENEIPGVEPFLRDSPYNLLRSKSINMPIIYGSTSNEGLFLINDETSKSLEKLNDRYLFGTDLEFASEEVAATESQRVKEFYFGQDRISEKNIMNLSDLYTHLHFEIPEILETQLLLESSNAPVYNYIFDYSGGRNFGNFQLDLENVSGASHGDEIFYLFNTPILTDPINEQDQIMIDWITKMWTNFAKYGNPTPTSATDLPTTWTPSSKTELNFLYIKNELTMASMPNPEAYQLWKDLYAKYRRQN